MGSLTSFTGIILDAGRMRAELSLTETGKLKVRSGRQGKTGREFSFKHPVEMSSANFKVTEEPVLQQKSGIWGRGPSWAGPSGSI